VKITDIDILGEPHAISYKDIKYHGIYTFGNISIKKKDTKVCQLRTIVHEAGHGYYEQTRDPDSSMVEEDFARLFELGVVDLVRNNWVVLEQLKEVV